MIRCKVCVMPNTRPDTPFVDGVCSACRSYQARPFINWVERGAQLAELLERHRNPIGYDCIVPSSGGKDSHYQVLELIRLGARPLVVTATTCHLTAIGRRNIDNLARYATTIEVTPNRTTRALLNRLGLELVGDISWPEHVGIFTIPFQAAVAYEIPLIFYGENPQNQYGGPPGSDEASLLTARWRSEFGGFLGLRPRDLIGNHGLTELDMADYDMPASDYPIEAHFLGHYIPWDSHRNAAIARAAGMLQRRPSAANYWEHENLDNAQTGLHDYMMFRKYGYGRGCAQASVDVRGGRISRECALQWVIEWDGNFPEEYAGVHLAEILERIGMTQAELYKVIEQFTDWDVLAAVESERTEWASRTE